MTLFGKILLNSISIDLAAAIPVSKMPTLFISKAPSSKKIYFLSKYGLRHPIDTFDTFQQYNFNLHQVLKVPPELVDMLPIGTAINSTYLPD